MFFHYKLAVLSAVLGVLCYAPVMAQDSGSEAEPKTQAEMSEEHAQSDTTEQPEEAPRQGLTNDIDSFFEEIEEDARSGDLDTSCSLPPEGIS